MKTKIILLAAAIAALTSCVINDGTQMNIVNIDVPSDSWNYSITAAQEQNDDLKYQGNYYWAEVNVPELSKDACDGGCINVYRVFEEDATQVELPYTRYIEIFSAPDSRYFYSETVDYEFKVGKIYIFYTASDFAYEKDAALSPDAMKFRCVIIK